jgi:hypothetical protein
MKFQRVAVLIVSSLLAHAAVAGHHEKGEGVMLAAQPGQVLIFYHWPCADAPQGLSLLKEMIAYERGASPYPYSASPGMHADGAVVSVDVHPSVESMEKATAWQAEDAQWQSLLGQMAEACGSVDDLTANVVTMK